MTVHGCSFTNILSLNFITGFVRENIKACFFYFIDTLIVDTFIKTFNSLQSFKNTTEF